MLRLESWKGILGSENVFVTGVSEGYSLDIKECTCALDFASPAWEGRSFIGELEGRVCFVLW